MFQPPFNAVKEIEEDLIERLRTGDERAYKQLFDNYYVLLCSMATEWVGDDFIAETIVSDAIFNIWKGKSQLVITTSLRNYLIRSVRNASINHLKSAYSRREITFSKLPATSELYQMEQDATLQPEGRLIEKELEERIRGAVESLPRECRQVFELCRFDGLSYLEAADRLSISVNTVKYHLKKAVKCLSSELSSYLALLMLFFIR